MDVRIRFRFNKATGQVEAFEIDDENSTLPSAEHNREHDRIAAEIGRVIERNPHVIEVAPGSAPVPSSSEAEGRDAQDSEKEENSRNPEQLR